MLRLRPKYKQSFQVEAGLYLGHCPCLLFWFAALPIGIWAVNAQRFLLLKFCVFLPKVAQNSDLVCGVVKRTEKNCKKNKTVTSALLVVTRFAIRNKSLRLMFS